MFRCAIISACCRTRRAVPGEYSMGADFNARSLEEKINDFFAANCDHIVEVISVSYGRAPEATESEIAIIVYKDKSQTL